MDPAPHETPESQSDVDPPKRKSQPDGCLASAAFMIGTAGCYLVLGGYYMRAVNGVDLHADTVILGTTCLLCPLVGLLVALLTWHLTKLID